MSQDARVRYTKMMIQNSFIQLVKQKPFSKIKLKEVCELSGINHSTFYRHYRDIFDWKEQLEASCIEQLKIFLSELDTDNIRDILSAQLHYYQANKELYAMLASRNFESAILEQFNILMIDNAETALKEAIMSNPKGKRKWNCYFTVHGIEGVIRCWVNDGMTETPEEVADYIVTHFLVNFNI